MKAEYYTLDRNGSIEKLSKEDVFSSSKKKTWKISSKNKWIIFINYMVLLLLGVTLTGIVSLHISNNIFLKISYLIKVTIEPRMGFAP